MVQARGVAAEPTLFDDSIQVVSPGLILAWSVVLHARFVARAGYCFRNSGDSVQRLSIANVTITATALDEIIPTIAPQRPNAHIRGMPATTSTTLAAL